MKSNAERAIECLTCDYFDRCIREVPDPKDKEDGTCKQKDIYENDEKLAEE